MNKNPGFPDKSVTKLKNIESYFSSLTASAIIASTTTSAMADPRFCTVKKTIRYRLELREVESKPSKSHGTRESTVDITKYGVLFFPPIGIQSEMILPKTKREETCHYYKAHTLTAI